MCLSIPARIKERAGTHGRVEFEGNTVDVDLTLVPDARAGDYVLVHAGFAIEQYDAEEAEETLSMLREALGEHRPGL
jgi:hydrogenase expression/formation protein HypC